MHVDGVKFRGAWLPWGAGPGEEDETPMLALCEWLRDQCDDYGDRLAIMPNSHSPEGNRPYLWLTQNHAPYRSAFSHVNGGPIIAAWPTEQSLCQSVSATPDGQALVALQWGDTRSLQGWATAAQAFNARTGLYEAPLDDELATEFERVLFWSNELDGGAKRGAGRERPQRHLRVLKDAGLDADFVVTYCIALGVGELTAKQVRKHYAEA